METLLHPVYFPNLVTAKALTMADVVWENEDNFQKQTYRNRCYICTDQGKHMLNVPIQHVGGSDGRQKYKEVRIDHSERWQLRHWRTLQTAYRTSAFFEFYEDDLAPIFERRFEFLIDLNFATLEFITSSLGLEMPTSKTQQYDPRPTGVTDLRHLAIAKGEKSWATEPYFQVFGDRHGFIGNLSVLDLLFNEGSNALTYLENQKIGI
ncbi:MAG: WbqC family protein [Flavobacteriaceae bacterium]|nr:WbqC family protein [Flavobacteriaceae bacterium]